ncbi:hypothetical protein PLICRDRAFT_516632 [Plicaturopsis crispa FD-325 SS-3]|nr:hypothetical protein PLICRDRAFT_516632 [Plicaturopsis crispa FD-325 SS-3]
MYDQFLRVRSKCLFHNPSIRDSSNFSSRAVRLCVHQHIRRRRRDASECPLAIPCTFASQNTPSSSVHSTTILAEFFPPLGAYSGLWLKAQAAASVKCGTRVLGLIAIPRPLSSVVHLPSMLAARELIVNTTPRALAVTYDALGSVHTMICSALGSGISLLKHEAIRIAHDSTALPPPQ